MCTFADHRVRLLRRGSRPLQSSNIATEHSEDVTRGDEFDAPGLLAVGVIATTVGGICMSAARAVLSDLVVALLGICLFALVSRLAARDPDVPQTGAREQTQRQDRQDGNETPHRGRGALGADGVLLGLGQVPDRVERG